MTGDGEPSTYDVRVWSVAKRVRRDGPRYRVRWVVAGKEWHDTFPTRALADSFRSELISVTRRGEAFVVATGRPVSWQRPEESVTSWYDHATCNSAQTCSTVSCSQVGRTTLAVRFMPLPPRLPNGCPVVRRPRVGRRGSRLSSAAAG